MSTAETLLTEVDPSPEVRVYRGRSIDELIPRIEAELGADAIVVRRRRGLEGGIGGFFQRPFVEVEAKPGTPRIDIYDEFSGAPALPPSLQAPAERETLSFESAVPQPVGDYVTDTLATIAAAGMAASAPTPAPVVEDPPGPSTVPAVLRELTPAGTPGGWGAGERPFEPPHRRLADSFGAALAEATQATEQALPASSPTQPGEQMLPTPSALPTLPTSEPPHERARDALERGLQEAGVGEELTRELIDAALAHTLPFVPGHDLIKAVHGALTARIPRTPLLKTPSATLAVVGPGGSGKTSFCAALLSAYRRAATLPASCATVVPAGEREELSMLLSPYIMEPLPLTGARARGALDVARREGLLLLDMPPLSPADREAVQQIAGLLSELEVDRVVVALPATLGAKATAQLLETLRPLQATGMAITHADETDQIGVAVEAACRFALAPEYLLDRRGVRGGLTRIDPTHLADRLLP